MIEGPRSEVEAQNTPDVFIKDLVVFDRPHVRLEELTRFDTLPAHHKGQFREWIESLAFTIIFVLVFTSYVAQATQVPSESMKPTILVGDHFFLDKIAFPANYPHALQKYLPVRTMHRGDIVAFWSPENPNIRLVKRVIGLPGETLEVRDRDVYIDGRKLDEPYVVHLDPRELDGRDNFGP